MNKIEKAMKKVDRKLKTESIQVKEITLDETFGNEQHFYRVYYNTEKVIYFLNELNFFISNISENDVYELKKIIESICHFCTNGFLIENYLEKILKNSDAGIFNKTDVYFTNDFITCERAEKYNFCLSLNNNKITVRKVSEMLADSNFITYIVPNRKGILEDGHIVYPTRIFTSEHFIFQHQDEYFYPIFEAMDKDDNLLSDMDVLIVKNLGQCDEANVMSFDEFKSEYENILTKKEIKEMEKLIV